ncbi:MAG: molybdopterin molybdenumtransferase MoeA [Alphaproteobacteria bacterium]|nr:molybdopterin molybdenumtransferase MoeA [Alphaproteobacteria bacterium]
MLSVAEAHRRIIASLSPLGTESIALAEAAGRVLREDVHARHDQPPGDLSAMDGYALNGADAARLPVRLPIAIEIPAGRLAPRPLARGEAARIFTGAALPEGADTIVIQENTTRDGDAVIIQSGATPGRHIRRRGLDFSEGGRILAAPRRLSASDLALAASAGATRLVVGRKPRVAILATGDELVPPGATPGPGQIVAASGVGVAAILQEAGAAVIDLGIAPDRAEAIAAAASHARGADLLVTLGGASVGDHDLIKSALAPMGLAIDFWKIALRPGKPLIFGNLNGLPLIGLPGNPVSSLVCALLFGGPAVGLLQGLAGDPPAVTPVRAGITLPANDGRADYLRASLQDMPGDLPLATPFPVQDSSMLSTLSASDCLVIRPPHAPKVPVGEIVPAHRLRV